MQNFIKFPPISLPCIRRGGAGSFVGSGIIDQKLRYSNELQELLLTVVRAPPPPPKMMGFHHLHDENIKILGP